MSYVERVLQPGEQVRHISSIHWIVYWAGVGVTLLAAVAYWLSETRPLHGSVPHKYQVTTYALRSLLIHAFSCTRDDIVQAFWNRWLPSTMIPIWPPTGDPITWPISHILGDADVGDISNAFHSYMMAPGGRIIG
jgi:hypothetical protein